MKRMLAVPEDTELVLAQAQALTRQVPLMYAMVLVNTLILTCTHIGTAPELLTVYIPAALSAVSLARIASWWLGRHALVDVEYARRSVRRMMLIMPFVSVGFIAWTIALLPYGGPFQQSHVVFFSSITTIGCMFCLMHVRAAALTMGVLTLLPLFLAVLSMGNTVLIAITINLTAVVLGMLTVLLGNYRDFAAMVASRSAIAQRQIETQRLSDENDRLANVDWLTGLPNRRHYERRLSELLQHADANGQQIAVARIDLDGFKSINSIFGRITGDRVLVETARRIMAVCPQGAFLARLAADSFALILSQPASGENLDGMGRDLCRAMRNPFDLPGANIHLSASVGLAASRQGDTIETIYDRADYVASLAKRECRGNALVFGDCHEHEIRKVRQLEHALRTANLDDEIYILFQPQFDVALNRIIGYEVLARWRSPMLGEISPIEFIPLAERCGLITKVTHTVLRKALAASAKLPKSIRLSVNLSAHDLGSATAVEAIVALVKTSGLPCRLDFEITETAVVHDLEQASDSLLTLLGLGARIALDDFGTGHSSLTHVQKLPLDRIKIDRSFVAEVCNDPTSRAIIQTTIDLCRNLGISCVFEGIETPDQLNALIALGGTVMQGYLFGRPADEAAMHALLEDERSDRLTVAQQKIGAAS
ncbi:MAG: putative bifunctional diguanylate cyclase/phosphodiesterase [Devosia sp.]